MNTEETAITRLKSNNNPKNLSERSSNRSMCIVFPFALRGKEGKTIDIGITRLIIRGENLIRRIKAEERHDSGRNLRRVCSNRRRIIRDAFFSINL